MPTGPEFMMQAAMKALGLDPAVVANLAGDLSTAITTLLKTQAKIVRQNEAIMAFHGIKDPTANDDGNSNAGSGGDGSGERPRLALIDGGSGDGG